MNNTKKTLAVAALALLTPLASYAQLSPVQEKIAAAMKMDHRTDAELARDEDRDPVNAMEFAGLKDNMTVIEFMPAAQAYYTKILGPVLADNGHLMVVDSQATFDRWGDWKDTPEFGMTHQVPIEASYNREERRYVPGELNFGVPAGTADMFLYLREYHNFNEADNVRINSKVFESLKSGGSYVIIDHTRRHMEPTSGANFRRRDPVGVIHEVQQAGFVLDKVSDMFAQESDALDQEVGRIPNMTDRFFLVFRKP